MSLHNATVGLHSYIAKWVATVSIHQRGQIALIPIDTAYSVD
jgi:hypothetical protein